MEMEDKTKSVYEDESGKSFILSKGNSIPATYTYSRKGIKDSNENFILELKSTIPRLFLFRKTTLNYDIGTIQIDHKKSPSLCNIYNQKADLYATMQFLAKNKIEIKTHGGTYYGKKKSKQIEIIDKNRNVCISIPANYMPSVSIRGSGSVKDFLISSNGSLSPELVSLIVQGWILWYIGGHLGITERFEDPDAFSFKIIRKATLNPLKAETFKVYNSNDEETMIVKKGYSAKLIILGFVLLPFIIGFIILVYASFTGGKKFTLKSIDGLDLGQLTRNTFSPNKITDFTTNTELEFYSSMNSEEFYSSMNSIIYDSRDNEILSIYGYNKDFKIYKEENRFSEVFIILISLMLILAFLIPRDTGGP